MIDLGAQVKSEGWLEIKKTWFYGTPLELSFQLLHEKETDLRKKSIQGIINRLLNEEKKYFLSLSRTGIIMLHFMKTFLLNVVGKSYFIL